MTTKLTNWYNEPPCKLIGHTVVKALPDGTIIEDDIVHTYNKNDGKRTRSHNPTEHGPYAQTEKSVVQGYIKDPEATNRFLKNNDVRHNRNGVWLRPAKPDEVGFVVSGEGFNSPHTREQGWTYADIQPGQCLWVESEDQSDDKPEAEPELTTDEETLVNRVADFTNLHHSDEDIERIVAEEIEQRQRIKAAVLRARGEK